MNNSSPKITLLLLTKNESKNISQNLNWLSNCKTINEVVCVDDFSSDDTVFKLKELSKRISHITFHVYQNSLNNNFSNQRNFALSKATNDWILWLDADEIPHTTLVDFLNSFIPTHFAYSFMRHDIFLGHQLNHGETSHQHFTRLYNKKYGQFINPVHEIWQPTTPIFPTKLVINHYSHRNLTGFLQKINFYTDIRANQLFSQKTKTSIFQIILYPSAKFIQNYIFRLGFLDSTPGIIMALCMSLHSFLVRAKLWKLWQK